MTEVTENLAHDFGVQQVSKPGVMRKHRILIVVLVLALLCLAGSIAYMLTRPKPLTKFSSTIISQLDYSTYFPRDLPEGYAINKSSIFVKAGVLTFSIDYDGGKKSVAVTEQQLPAGYDTSRLSGTQEFTTSHGKAYIVEANSRTTGSLVTDKTWVIINAPQPMGAEQMRTILNGLTPLPASK